MRNSLFGKAHCSGLLFWRGLSLSYDASGLCFMPLGSLICVAPKYASLGACLQSAVCSRTVLCQSEPAVDDPLGLEPVVQFLQIVLCVSVTPTRAR